MQTLANALLELAVGDKEPVALPAGQTRTYLGGGNAVVLRDCCEGPGAARIGFGECRGTVLEAPPTRF